MLEALTGDAAHARHLGRLLSRSTAPPSTSAGATPTCTKRFFRQLGQLMPERVVLIMARHGGRYVAGALNLLGDDTLYGRIWGCRQEFEFLHFEACYYQAIEFAIAHGLARVEAGAQGMHKLQRGYEPVPTYSAHWIRDAGFRRRGRALPRPGAPQHRGRTRRAAPAPAVPPGLGALLCRLGLLCAGRFCAAEHAFEAQILVDIRPVDAAAGSGHLPSSALLRRRMIQSGYHHSGVTIFRPSLSDTTRSWSVH